MREVGIQQEIGAFTAARDVQLFSRHHVLSRPLPSPPKRPAIRHGSNNGRVEFGELVPKLCLNRFSPKDTELSVPSLGSNYPERHVSCVPHDV